MFLRLRFALLTTVSEALCFFRKKIKGETLRFEYSESTTLSVLKHYVPWTFIIRLTFHLLRRCLCTKMDVLVKLEVVSVVDLMMHTSLYLTN